RHPGVRSHRLLPGEGNRGRSHGQAARHRHSGGHVIVIGLTGYKGSGKTTVAEFLVKDHGFTEVSFAAPLKRMVRNLDPIVGYQAGSDDCDCDDCYDPENYRIRLSDLYSYGFDDEEIKTTRFADEVRRLHERFGTEVMRAEDPNYWIRQLAREIEDLRLNGHRKIVVSDVRFPNEAEFIHSYTRIGDTAELWNITRTEAMTEEGEPQHCSAAYAGQMRERVTIVNDFSFEELAETVAMAVEFVHLPDK